MQIRIKKERIKFSIAHMTVFPDGTKEALHGHNYQIELRVLFTEQRFEETISFSEFKKPLEKLSALWDERVLLAEKCPFFKIQSKNQDSIQFILCGKQYVIPSDEVVLLNTDNITSENLAIVLSNEFLALLPATVKSKIQTIEMIVEETPGQGACYETRVNR